MIKRERQIVDEDEIEILLEEKKLEEEEKRLQRLKDELSKSKANHRDEFEKLTDNRKVQRL